MSLNGKTAVVTGGASGIGRAISLQLAQDGAAVSVWDLDEKGAEETARMIKDAGGRAMACTANAAAAADIATAAQHTRAEFGPITILVNNAGIAEFKKLFDIDEAAWDRMMAINLKGPFLCTKEIAPDMLSAGWGRIINISSSSAQSGSPMMSHYVASKGGVIGFTKALAMEFADKGITVNNVPPGSVDTPLLRKSPMDMEKAAAMMPMKHFGKPGDIACAVSYLASEGAGYVTGQTISVNGGRYLV